MLCIALQPDTGLPNNSYRVGVINFALYDIYNNNIYDDGSRLPGDLGKPPGQIALIRTGQALEESSLPQEEKGL